MSTKPSLRLPNICLLIRNEIILNKVSVSVVMLAVFGILLLLSALDTYGTVNLQFHRNFFLMVFYPAGILLTSRVFNSLHDPLRGNFWLLLPASALDKIASKVLFTTVIYIVVSMLVFYLFSAVSEGINTLVTHRSHPLFNPLDPLILKCAAAYFPTQAPFLIGAVYFKKNRLSKTILSLLVLAMIFTICILAVGWRLFADTSLVPYDFDSLFYTLGDTISGGMGSSLETSAKLLVFVVFPLFCWIVCYFRHTETEL